MQCYNPKTNLWNMCAPMQVERHSPCLAVVDGKIYAVGGRYYDVEEDDWYDTVDTWMSGKSCLRPTFL